MATPKAVPQDTLGQQLLAQILGGGNRQTTTTSAGNIAPAMQVFNQASLPLDQTMLTALMSSIQQNAAQNVPVLTQALANATGSRSSNNSPLALALNQQNNDANNQALVAILENNLKQMGQANQAAGTIAQATRGTSQTQQTGMKNPTQLLLGGMVLNNADKKGVFKKIGKKWDDWTSTPTDKFSGYNVGQGFVDPAADAMAFEQLPNNAFSGYNLNNFSDPASFDYSGMGGAGDLAGMDFSGYNLDNFVDPAAYDFPVFDFSAYSDFSSIPTEAFYGFADGGKVDVSNKGLSRRAVIDAQELSAARGIPMDQALREVLKMYAAPESMGVSLPQADVDAALNAPVVMQQGATPITSQTNSIPQVLMNLLMRPGRSPLNFEQRYADGGSLTGPTENPGLTSPVVRNRANMGSRPRRPSTNVAGGTGLNNTMISDMTTQLVGQTKQRMTKEEFERYRDEKMSEYEAAKSEAKRDALQQGVGNAVLNYFTAGLYGLANRATGGNLGNAVHKVAEPFADAGDELTSSIIEDAKDPFGSALDPGRPFEVVRNVFKAFGFADGGQIEGPGTGTSDSIVAHSKVPGASPVRLSNKEYIIPEDTVNIVGKQFFDNLLAATHTPVRR